jgi:hypothetical protein
MPRSIRARRRAVGNDAVLTDLLLDLGAFESQMAIIRSTVFMRRAVEKERLYFGPPDFVRRGE